MIDDLKKFPKCLFRLKVAGTNFKDPLLSPYWCAVSVSAGLDDELMLAFGGFDFDDRSDANGWRLLSRLERFLKLRSSLFGKLMSAGQKRAA